MSKKILMTILLLCLAFGAVSCTRDINNNQEITGEKNDPQQKTYQLEDIETMFFENPTYGKNILWGSAIVVDKVYDKVGAVLFEMTPGQGTVAFLDADGHFSSTATPVAPLSSEPNFMYRGDGVVTFNLLDEQGAAFEYKLTFSQDKDGNVLFSVE